MKAKAKSWKQVGEQLPTQDLNTERKTKQGRQIIGQKHRGTGEINTDDEQANKLNQVRTETSRKLNKGRK